MQGLDETLRDKRIAIFLLTGFLGAGKTTFLNLLLDELGREHTALLINEFGAIGIDGSLIENADDTLIEISGGCICCTVRGEVADALLALSEHGRPRLAIETTGLANPLPLLQTLLLHPEINRLYRLGPVIAVVDALQGDKTLSTHEESVEQVAMADFIYLSKTDLVKTGGEDGHRSLARLRQRLHSINPFAIQFEHEQISKTIADLVNAAHRGEISVNHPHHHEDHENHEHHEAHHTERFRSLIMTHDRPIALERLIAFLDLVTSAHGDHVPRMKGYVALAGKGAVLVQAVANRYELSPAPVSYQAHDQANGHSRIVAITDGLDPDFLSRLFAGFAGIVKIDTPDHQALSSNPLAIGGNWQPAD